MVAMWGQRLDICQLSDAGIDPMLARDGGASTPMARLANLVSMCSNMRQQNYILHHLVGAGKHRKEHGEAARLAVLIANRKPVGWQLHGLCPFKNVPHCARSGVEIDVTVMAVRMCQNRTDSQKSSSRASANVRRRRSCACRTSLR
jgi:hypothetical protein